jgi:glycosyltransferase involved in cell wall biosynthesis
MKRLLVIDSLVSSRSPAMRGWLAAAGKVLPQRFDEVEVWGFDCELKESWVSWKRIRPVTSKWAIQSVFYEIAVNRMLAKLPPTYFAETLVQCTGTHLTKTDIRFVHFWNTAYAEAAVARPKFLKLPLKDKIFGPLIQRGEAKALIAGSTGEWWCVSRGIAAPIIRDAAVPPLMRYLPNSYNPARFNHEVRERWHAETRKSYGFAPDDIVLGFSAFGHFERKGLGQAAQAVATLRSMAHPVKLLVLGGTPATVRDFRKKMKHQQIDLDGIHFAGLVNEMEKHLSAADAFFMPSHFEAFSLAEIEAAALGLRLYLTAHPGHEMILKEGVNGRLLPWEPKGMAKILDEEIRSGDLQRIHHEMGEALIVESYATAMAAHYDAAIARKWGP